MTGRLEQDQGQLFYSFCLEEVVPDDHQVRAIASVLDLSWVNGELRKRTARYDGGSNLHQTYPLLMAERTQRRFPFNSPGQ
jgi:hypothetical protein